MHPNGSKYWRLKYRIVGKEKVLSLGTYPIVTLGAAREKALKAKEMLLEHIDPSQAKKEKKLQVKTEAENSFEQVARCWHENQKHGWTERHANYVLRRMEADIFPALGFKAIENIKEPELLAALRCIEARGTLDIFKNSRLAGHAVL